MISLNAIRLLNFLKKIQNQVEANEAIEIITGSEGIEESLKEITQTLNLLLDVDRVSTGNVNLERRPCDINALIEATIIKKFPELNFILRLSPNLPNAFADPEGIEKIFD